MVKEVVEEDKNYCFVNNRGDLNDIELISFKNQVVSFPKHFHYRFCFSLVNKGINQIDFINHSIYSEAGWMSIVNPYEVHSNPVQPDGNHTQFETIYIPIKLICRVLEGKCIKFKTSKIHDRKANSLFNELKKALRLNQEVQIENALYAFIKSVTSYSEEHNYQISEIELSIISEINSFIESNLQNKFCLDELSSMANINKFSFVKKFKHATGMTPINYILMRKVFACRGCIHPKTNLTALAHQYSFTDGAHFSKTFKRYIGISPENYKNNFSRNK